MTFYTYLWLREDGTPYYAGKSFHGRGGNRAFRRGSPPKDRIRIQIWPDEATALAYERYFIEFYGRKDLGTGCLINLTYGGEGTSGHTMSKEGKQILRLVHLGKKLSAVTRQRISSSHKGVKKSSEHIRKAREGRRIFKLSPEACLRMSLSQKGKIRPIETRNKMSRAKKGKKYALGYKHTPEARKKISQSLVGNKRTLGFKYPPEAYENRRGKRK